MRSQLRFVMHPDDESEFAARVLSDDSVCLIDGPRWKSSTPETFRSLDGIARSYCIIWSKQDRAVLSARCVSACDDWYCESESVTIQFLRSQTVGDVVTEGRIAVSTADAGDEEARGVERRFRTLVRFIKTHYANAAVHWINPGLPIAPARPGRSANPSKPDPQVWIGPHAVRWLRQDKNRCIKQSPNSAVEAHLIEAGA